MTSASISSAKNLFHNSKRRLSDRVIGNVNNAASVARQIVRGSRSNELWMQAAKNFAQQETTIENSLQNLRKMELLRQHMGHQCDSIIENSQKLKFLKEQVEAMER